MEAAVLVGKLLKFSRWHRLVQSLRCFPLKGRLREYVPCELVHGFSVLQSMEILHYLLSYYYFQLYDC